MRKKIKCLFWSPLTNRYNSQLFFGCTHLRVHWGHARRHGKQSLEKLTAERAGYTQEMDCHYSNSWSVHRCSVCKSWLVLMCLLNIVVFSCDQAALWMVFSVRPAVRLSVCLSVCLSACPSVRLSHLFEYGPIIVSSWNFQKLSPRTRVRSMPKVKVRGQRSRSQKSQPNLTVSGL